MRGSSQMIANEANVCVCIKLVSGIFLVVFILIKVPCICFAEQVKDSHTINRLKYRFASRDTQLFIFGKLAD